MKKNTILKCIVTVTVICVSLFFLQKLLQPKYMSNVVEGRLIAEYYDEEKDHDVIFVGDCEVYENFSPKVLWEEYGINSYIRGSAQQLIWQSYYLLEDTLRYEKPDVVIFNILAMMYNEPQKEAYNRMTIDGMNWSMAKVKYIQASMTEREEFLDYVFPILRYHSRWNELSGEDITYMFDTPNVAFNGYYMRVDVKPAENIPEGKILANYQFGDNSYYYLDKMVELCKKEGVELIFVKAPSLYPYWYPEWEEQMEEYAAEHGIRYINFLENVEETGVDFAVDTYDAGLHMNISGAEKITRFLGEVLSKEVGLEDRRGEDKMQQIWEPKIKAYEEEIMRQKEKYGMN